MADVKLQRSLQRFQSKIDGGAFYEAHQTLRTITNRYVKAKQYQEAIDLLYQGSSILSKNKEYASSSDLISYLIQVFVESGVTVADNKDLKLKLIELITHLPDSDPSLNDLAKQALKWSQGKDEKDKFGDVDLHHIFGAKYLNYLKNDNGETIKNDDERQKVFAVTELHLILGTYESLPLYVNYLYQWAQVDTSIDAGLFLSRAVINYAYLKNIKFANEAKDLFLKQLSEDKSGSDTIVEGQTEIVYYEQFPILSFLQLLLVTLGKQNDSSNGQKFVKLYNHYKVTLSAADLLPPVEYLGKLYFGLKLGNATGGSNMLANLMGDFFK
ncbi:predicted protein [Scheffersomyces stipitis CBS 6054]|uniref:Golgi to ER traffic protein 4 n=1 Tax=Scheffersomyces stipitis (strain ATCC 58785 / CBS 6054 / NBRC 10063 / NRRL Y-11545) TaxID=322104 RepID=A3LVA6_PICST|nr:predicted protein [Scheffersomyces stipitis CBS 6054]ABN67090.2 predicted protein [Scheffersomyces stipitis CBS 6054]KAG2734894.1 hypothetical protein G9P44_002900 [Scheffersomyces stipitis]